MRARPNASGEQLVQEYLTRVAQAARLLPKGARMAFVGRTKALVEREVGPPGARTDPQHVIEVLTRLGKPEDLVAAERTRIESGWARSGAGSLGVSDASPDVSPGELDHDRRAFTRKVVDCLSDRRIAVYFNRNLVSHHDVTDELVNGTAFSQALQTTSYEAFTEIRAQLNETARYNSEVLDGDAINARTRMMMPSRWRNLERPQAGGGEGCTR